MTQPAPEKPTLAKAFVALITALSGTLLTALAENGITATEWVTIASTTVVAFLGVYAVTNSPGGVSLGR